MNRQELIEQAKTITQTRIKPSMDMDEKMDVLEITMMELMDKQVMVPPVGHVSVIAAGGPERAKGRWLMHEEPRLPEMPKRPTLIDFYRLRFALNQNGYMHLLQSARLAMDKGLSEKIILACLLHDISVVGFIRTDHGHWAAQMIVPYVDEEITWAVRHHQSLRFCPAPDYDYDYPKLYTMAFGEDYTPPDYVKAEWAYCKTHKWYDSAMQVVVNDYYAFDPDVKVDLADFEGIIARNFYQPKDGLGFDGSSVAHMWRTLIWPNNFL